MSYITKNQKEIQTKNANAKIEFLMITFANHMLKLRCGGEPVTEDEMKDFVKSLEKK
jgi:hypothetical protein